MRVITPASRERVVSRVNEAETKVRQALVACENDDAERALRPLREAIDALRDIQVEIDPL